MSGPGILWLKFSPPVPPHRSLLPVYGVAPLSAPAAPSLLATSCRFVPSLAAAQIYFAVLLGAIAYARKHLWELSGPPVDAEPLVSPATLLAVRLVGLLWSGGFLIAMQRKTGCWPMVGLAA